MQLHDLFKIFIGRLNDLHVRYMITGSVASIIYGEPRLTHDIDMVIAIDIKDIDLFEKAFPLEKFYCPPAEVIRVETARQQRGHFNLIHHKTGFKADIYTLGNDELHLWAIENRIKIEMDGEVFWLASPEYVIIRKLEYFREGGSEKHLKDISGILRNSSDQIDFKQLTEKISDRSLEKEWHKIQGSQ